LGKVTVYSRPIAGQDLLAVPVTAVSDSVELVHLQNSLGLLAHGSKLSPITAIVDDLMRHDEVVLGLDRHLHVVADDPGAAPAGRHRAGIRVRQRDLLVRGSQQLRL